MRNRNKDNNDERVKTARSRSVYNDFLNDYFPEESVTSPNLVNEIKDVQTLIQPEQFDGSEFEELAETGKVINEEANECDEYLNGITQVVFDDDSHYKIGFSSIIGKRDYQQDAIWVPSANKTTVNGKDKFICVLSDGMGGLYGGETASRLVTETFSEVYYETLWGEEECNYFDFLSNTADIVNKKVKSITDKDGRPAKSGATVIVVTVEDNSVYFLNIGDSRLYLVRDGKIVQLTHDQNYLSVLLKKVSKGEITAEEALSHPKREALVSFCGVSELKTKEINLEPLQLRAGDVLLLCTDGLYRLVQEQEMVDIISENEDDMCLAALRLTTAATGKNNRSQDNTSVILIKNLFGGEKYEFNQMS